MDLDEIKALTAIATSPIWRDMVTVWECWLDQDASLRNFLVAMHAGWQQDLPTLNEEMASHLRAICDTPIPPGVLSVGVGRMAVAAVCQVMGSFGDTTKLERAFRAMQATHHAALCLREFEAVP